MYCQRTISEDVRLARQSNALCDGLTEAIKVNFVAELDMLAPKFVPGKMAEFMKETLGKDVPNLMKLQILGREFELRHGKREGAGRLVEYSRKRGLFVGFPLFVSLPCLLWVDTTVVVGLVGGVAVLPLLLYCSSVMSFVSCLIWVDSAVVVGIVVGVAVFQERQHTVLVISFPIGSKCTFVCVLYSGACAFLCGFDVENVIQTKIDKAGLYFSTSFFHGRGVILSAAGEKKVRGVVPVESLIQVMVQTDEYGYLVISFMIQHEFITLTLAQFGQILKIPYNGQVVFTNEWDLGSLEYSQDTKGPYSTDLPTFDDIRRLLELERVMIDRGHRDHLPACLAHMLYCVVAEEQYNLAYFFVKRIECARANPTAFHMACFLSFLSTRHGNVSSSDNGIYDIVDRVMRPLALKQTRRPRSDNDKARHSVSSSSSHHQGTSSHQHNDDDDDDDV
ncbi:hypothetical protein Tco_0875122 [Tanacetum coccineum]|uniref:Uncharacterized protein n=1 Tax=Tanacetum coccineum TaxID=301880 RepID=A0ABQ5BNK2_9ASTR